MIRLTAAWMAWCVCCAALGIALFGCASRVHVESDVYELTAEVNTGTRVIATEDGVLIERTSARETVGELDDVIGGAIGEALRRAIKGPVP